MSRTTKRLCVVFCLVFMVSCAGLQVAETPIGTYAKALGVWTDSVTQFKFYYEKADEETKARWDKDFRPILIKSKEVLNIWRIHLDAGEMTEGDIAQWKAFKNEIIYFIATQMG